MIYDKAHDLAKALKNSEEYRGFAKAKEVLATDPEAKKMVGDFLKKQAEFEYLSLSGKEDDKSARIEQLQKMYELLAYNPKAHSFMEAYMRFQRIMSDVTKIIGDAVAEGMDFFAKE